MFAEPSSSPEKLEDLVVRNALESVPEPARVAFVWDTDALRWFVGFLVHVITTADGIQPWEMGFHTGSLGYRSPPPHDRYSCSATDIMIPNVLEGVLITAIWQDVFNGSGLTSVAFDENSSITRIHARAFRNNILKSIDLPEGLERIDLLAFADNGLTQLVLPSSIHTVEQNAFQGNPITKITIGSGVTVGDAQSFGIHGATFKALYDSEDGGAGTYTWNGTSWVKQP